MIHLYVIKTVCLFLNIGSLKWPIKSAFSQNKNFDREVYVLLASFMLEVLKHLYCFIPSVLINIGECEISGSFEISFGCLRDPGWFSCEKKSSAFLHFCEMLLFVDAQNLFSVHYIISCLTDVLSHFFFWVIFVWLRESPSCCFWNFRRSL